jgi:hypothetical protein
MIRKTQHSDIKNGLEPLAQFVSMHTVNPEGAGSNPTHSASVSFFLA